MKVVINSNFKVVSPRSLEIKRGDDLCLFLYFLNEEGENTNPVERGRGEGKEGARFITRFGVKPWDEFNKDQFFMRGEVHSDEFRQDEKGEWYLPLIAGSNNALLEKCLGTNLSVSVGGELSFKLLGDILEFVLTTQTLPVLIYADIIRGNENNGEQVPLYPTHDSIVDVVQYEMGEIRAACYIEKIECQSFAGLATKAAEGTKEYADACVASADKASTSLLDALAAKEEAKGFATKANTQADRAARDASNASRAVEMASNQATVASREAIKAAESVTSAESYAKYAQDAAKTAEAQAEASIKKAEEAGAFATSAATTATAQSGIATTKAQAAESSAKEAKISENMAVAKATLATKNAQDAVIAAEEAADSAAGAAASESRAQARAIESGDFAFTSKQYANDVLASKNAAKESEYNAASSAEYAISAATRAQNAAEGAEDVIALSAKTDAANIFSLPQTFNAGVSLNGGATIMANTLPAAADVVTAGQAIANYMTSSYTRHLPAPLRKSSHINVLTDSVGFKVETLPTLVEGVTSMAIFKTRDELGMDGANSNRSPLAKSMHVAQHLGYPTIWSVVENWGCNYNADENPYITALVSWEIAVKASLLGIGCLSLSGEQITTPCFVVTGAIRGGFSLDGCQAQIGPELFSTITKSRIIMTNFLPDLKSRIVDMIIMSQIDKVKGTSFFVKMMNQGGGIKYLGSTHFPFAQIDNFTVMGVGAQKHERYAAITLSPSTITTDAAAVAIIDKQGERWSTRSDLAVDKMWDTEWLAITGVAKVISILPSWMPSTATWTMEVLAGGGTLSALSGTGQAPVTLSLSEFNGPAQYLWHIVKLTAKYNDNLTIYTHAIIRQSAL